MTVRARADGRAGPLAAVWAPDTTTRTRLTQAARAVGFRVRASGRPAEHAKALADGTVHVVLTINAAPPDVPGSAARVVQLDGDDETLMTRLAALYDQLYRASAPDIV